MWQANEMQDFQTFVRQKRLEPIQMSVIDLLDPLATKSVDQFMEGILDVWMSRTLLTQHNKNINESCQNLVQIVLYT